MGAHSLFVNFSPAHPTTEKLLAASFHVVQPTLSRLITVEGMEDALPHLSPRGAKRERWPFVNFMWTLCTGCFL